MRTILFFLLINVSVFAQSFVQKSDGTKIAVPEGSITIEPVNKRIVYKTGNVKNKIKYKDLSHAAFNGSLFRVFKEGKRSKGYFVLAESAGKTLAAIADTRSKPAGGFEKKFSRIEMCVYSNTGGLVERIVFSDDRNDKNTMLRADAAALIRSHFGDCEAPIQRLEAFEMTDTETQNNGISKFVESKIYTDCR